MPRIRVRQDVRICRNLRRHQAINSRALHDLVIVRRGEARHVSRGGIGIPDSATEKPVQGEILMVDNGRIPKAVNVSTTQVAPGDRILFGKYAGTEIKLEERNGW